jgi:hypothetical protein
MCIIKCDSATCERCGLSQDGGVDVDYVNIGGAENLRLRISRRSRSIYLEEIICICVKV